MSDYASSVLGAALLQGWTMSAQECKLPDCPGCPLMVSRDGKDSFCARCDGGAKVGLPRPGLIDPLSEPLSKTQASSPTSSQHEADRYDDETVLDDIDIVARQPAVSSVPDTPPTPQLSLPSPLTPEAGGSTNIDPMVQAARRQQSDQASAAIGQRLLQGWTLLGEECQNDSCYGVPLMKRPNPNRKAKRDDSTVRNAQDATNTMAVDPRRLCVICGREYLREADLGAWNAYLAQQDQQASSSSSGLANPVAPITAHGEQESVISHSAAAKKRRFSTQPNSTVTARSSNKHSKLSSVAQGKLRAVEPSMPEIGLSLPVQAQNATKPPAIPVVDTSASSEQIPQPTSSAAPSSAVAALNSAVSALSAHLTALCQDGVVPDSSIRNSRAIADTADDLARTVKALSDVQRLIG